MEFLPSDLLTLLRMESGGVSIIHSCTACSWGEGGVSMLTGILDRVVAAGVAGSFLGGGFVIFIWDVNGGCVTLGVVSGAGGVGVGNTTVGFTVVSLFICFDSP